MKHMLYALLPEPAIAVTGESFVCCGFTLTGSMQRVRCQSKHLPLKRTFCVDTRDLSATWLLEKCYLGPRSGSAGCAVALDGLGYGHRTGQSGNLKM